MTLKFECSIIVLETRSKPSEPKNQELVNARLPVYNEMKGDFDLVTN